MRIEDFRGIHSGRTFILGNGPSLTDHELHRLPEWTFGINRSFKACRTNYLVASDMLTFREHREELKELRLREQVQVFAAEGRFPEEDRGWLVPLKSLDGIGWSWDLAQGVYPRFSTYVAMQLAVYMGFTDIVLLGTDLSSKGKGEAERGHFFSQGPLDNPWIGDARFQSECFGYAAGALAEVERGWPDGPREPDVRVRVVPPCPLRCFEHVSFEEVVT